MAVSVLQYRVITKWTGWVAGWGSESDIAGILNAEAQQGWRLSRTESQRSAWMWFFPRIKLLMVFERQA